MNVLPPSGGGGAPKDPRFRLLQPTASKATQAQKDEQRIGLPPVERLTRQREELSAEERQALGLLAKPLESLRTEQAPPPVAGEWREVLETVRREMARTDLTASEKRLMLHDIYLAQRQRRGWLWAVTGFGVVLAVALLLLRVY